MRKTTKKLTAILAAVIVTSTFGSSLTAKNENPKGQQLKPKADTNSDGLISLEEFILFQGDRAMKRRDRNNDGILTKSEWIGQNKADGFYAKSFKRFDANKNDILSPAEIVEIYSWVFSRRDKNKSGDLSLSEVPKFFLSKK